MSALGVAVLVFARAPVPGAVKSRLSPGLAPVQAARLYAAMLDRAVASACASLAGPVTVHCAPDTRHRAFATLAARYGVALASQHGDDLGERMQRALADAVATHGAAVLMGSDAPMLDAPRVRAAADALRDGVPACFVPAVDGGYALVGLATAPPPELFRDVPWGGPEVMRVSRTRLRALGWSWWESSPVRDVDRIQDLDLLPADLQW